MPKQFATAEDMAMVVVLTELEVRGLIWWSWDGEERTISVEPTAKGREVLVATGVITPEMVDKDGLVHLGTGEVVGALRKYIGMPGSVSAAIRWTEDLRA